MTPTSRSAWLLCGLLLAGGLQPLTPGPASAEPVTDRPATDVLRPEVSQAAGFGISPPVRSLSREAASRPAPAGSTGRVVQPEERGQRVRDTGFTGDAAVQPTQVRVGGPQVTVARANFEGIENADNLVRQDRPNTDGDVGPNHYVQMVESSFAIYSKTGVELVPPTPLEDVWGGSGVQGCTVDLAWPIVLHDQLADRWVLTAVSGFVDGAGYFNCIAVSTTADPTGSYYQYAFNTGGYRPSNPKYGVWPDAYYASQYEIEDSDHPEYSGAAAYAFDRDAMLVGDPSARAVKFLRGYLSGNPRLPSDLDGNRLPPAGSPNYFIGTNDNGFPFAPSTDAINVFQFRVDFDNPAASSFTNTAIVPVPSFDAVFPCGDDQRSCVAQPSVTQRLSVSYGQLPSWRAAYRNFGLHESVVFTQTVEARPGVAGVRWYELRDPGSPQLYQASTWAPDDGVNRWLGSAVQDRRGNLALGYNVTNGTDVFPGIRVALRRVNDPLNTLRPAEQVMIAGTGSQTGTSYWSRNSSARVDPVDDCTFWFTGEYYETTGSNWQTRIGSFRTVGCTG